MMNGSATSRAGVAAGSGEERESLGDGGKGPRGASTLVARTDGRKIWGRVLRTIELQSFP